MEVNIDLFRKYYVVVSEKSINSAARKLNMTQPALSKSMSILEHQMRAVLFNRTSQGIILTSDGEETFEYAKTLLFQHQEFVKKFREKKKLLCGSLKIVAFFDMGEEWLMKFMGDFMDQFPDINVSVTGDWEEVRDFNFDVGIGYFIPNNDRLIQEELFKCHTQLYASGTYLTKHGIPLTESDLNNHRIIFCRNPSVYHSYKKKEEGLLYFKKKEISGRGGLEVSDLKGIINAALKDCGIVEIPSCVAKNYPQLRRVLPKIKGKKLPVYFIYQNTSASNRKIQAFYNMVKEKSKEKER